MFFIFLIIILWALADGDFMSLVGFLAFIFGVAFLINEPAIGIPILLIVLFLIFIFNNNSSTNQPNNISNTNVENNKKQEQESLIIINKQEDEKERKLFFELLTVIKTKNPNDYDYSQTLYKLGNFYDKFFQDYFRSASYLYLSTLHDKNNKMYENAYIQECKKLRDKKGPIWEYYVTLVNDVNDIDKYANELLKNDKKDTQPIQKKNYTNDQAKHSYNKQPIYYENKFEEFNAESYLHSLGYKVGKTGLSEYQRRKLLKKAIESGDISKYDVIETLERNISIFQNHPNRQRAVDDWWDDLYYVKENF